MWWSLIIIFVGNPEVDVNNGYAILVLFQSNAAINLATQAF